MKIKIKRIENGKLPEYKTDGAAGADCYARLKKSVIVKAGKTLTIPLGFAVEIPKGYEMQIRPRSGLASKSNIEAIIGTIDSDYRGEVGAIILNNSEEDFEIKNEDRVAQAVICPVIKAEWHLTDKLSETGRGEGGFGSTGVSENKEIEMSYPHKVEKFYEPFGTVNEVEKYLEKEVIIDKCVKGKVYSVYWSDFLRIVFKSESGKMFNLYATSAFERVTIDGHRFGK